MKNRLLITATMLLLAVSPVLRAADEPKTPLGEKMDALKKDYDAVKKAVNAGTETPDTLVQLTKAKAALEASLTEKPKNLALVPAAAQAEYLKGYDTELRKTIELFGKLETALKAKNHDAAVALVKDIDALQKSSHTSYRAKPKA